MAAFAFLRYSSASFILASFAAPLKVVVTIVLLCNFDDDDDTGTLDNFEAPSLVDCTIVGFSNLEIAVTLRCDSVEPTTAEEETEAGNPPRTLRIVLLVVGEASPNNTDRLSWTLDL
jgi:hypothetical protein